MTDWTPQCVLCAARGRSTRLDAGHCCPACAGWITRTLSDISRLVAEGYASGDRQRVGSGSGRPVFGSRPPLDVESLDPGNVLVRDRAQPPFPTLLEVLESWERMVREERSLSPYGPASLARGGASVHGCVGFLLSSAEWITTTPDFPLEDYAESLRDCLRAVRRWDVDAAAKSYAVPCPTEGDDGPCGYMLRFAEADDAVSCRRCGATRTAAQVIRVGMSSAEHEMWVDPEALCSHYGIHESTLRRWARRDMVRRSHGRYLVSDVEAVLRGVSPLAK